MDCQELNNHILDFCDDSASPQMYLKISKHLKDCPHCQAVYQLTRLENEVLRDTTDIPALPPDFTSRVMGSVAPMHRGPALLHNRRLWLGGLAAVAVVALFLYGPQFFRNQPAVQLADNTEARGNGTGAPSVVTTPGDSELGQIIAKDEATTYRFQDEPKKDIASLNAVPADVPSSPFALGTNESPLSAASPGEEFSTPMLFLSDQALTPSPTVPLDSVTVARSLMADGNNSAMVVENFEPMITPLNVPANLKLTQVDISASDRTVYDYTSTDGLAQVKITVEPYVEPTAKMRAIDGSKAEGINSLARWVLIGDKMVTVTYSGNVSLEELTNLANSLTFE